MKALLLSTLLLTSKPDTVPYIRHGYYEADTLNTEKELRAQHRKDQKAIKQAERTHTVSFIIGIFLGAFLGVGISTVTN